MEGAKILALFMAVTFHGFAGQTPNGLSVDNVKERQVHEIDLAHVTITNAITRILRAGHVPGGVVTVTTCGANETYTFAPVGSTLRDALDSVVIADPRYEWYIDEGAINLVPSSKKPALLDVIIKDFKVNHTKTLDKVVRELLSSPEVRSRANELHLTQGAMQIGIAALDRPGSAEVEESNDFTLHVQNLSVRDILNTIARMHGTAVWSYHENLCKGETEFSVGFLVQ